MSIVILSEGAVPRCRNASQSKDLRLFRTATARIFLTVLLAILLLAATQPAPAQNSGPDTGIESNVPGAGFGTDDAAPATPTIHVYSRETIIDILALDDKGQPVSGLTRDDFTILEDNHPQPIRSFREYSVAGTPVAPPALPPNTYTNAQALPVSGPVQIFYFQMPPAIAGNASLALGPNPAVTPGANIVRAKQYIADYLRTMPAGTIVAVFAFVPGAGLQLVQGFTTDGAKAASALDKLVVQRLNIPNLGYTDPIAAADQIGAYVAGIHGRKDLIWIGRPLMITRDGGATSGAPCATNCSSPDSRSVNRLMDTFDRYTQEEIAIYPFNPAGVVVGRGALGWNTLMAEKVAEETGGSAVYNTNDFKSAVAKIVDQSSHFYTISYVPTRPDADGHFHPIAIKVDRPGVHLTYRTGYNDEQPRQPDPVLAAHMTQGPMQLGALPTSQLLFTLKVEQTPPARLAEYAAAEAKIKSASDSDRKKLDKSLKGTPYDAVFLFDPTQIAFTNGLDGRRTANLEFDLGAYDAYSNLVASRSQAIKLVLSATQYDDFMKTTFRFYLPIPLPHGQLTLRAGLFDTVGNKSGSFEVPLAVAKK